MHNEHIDEQDAHTHRLPSVIGQQGLHNTFIPAVDVYETSTHVVVEMPLAGVHPEDVTVQVEQGMLSVQGESRKEREVEEKNYYRKEVRSGSFSRQVPLPVAVTEDGVIAEYGEGILRIQCPKAAPSNSKRISVKVTKKGDNK
ncbi:MAG: Hsp20/alpha crystallin family protein [Candidatus Magasanikbacteria bacterium]|jgi:HSP20 family protein|nr:Hsp20/alpha crystallin family protein [Candidatus Magasanikbacteria bacterium]